MDRTTVVKHKSDTQEAAWTHFCKGEELTKTFQATRNLYYLTNAIYEFSKASHLVPNDPLYELAYASWLLVKGRIKGGGLESKNKALASVIMNKYTGSIIPVNESPWKP